MADYRAPIASEIDLVFNARQTGIAAQIQYRVADNDGNVVVGPTGTGLVELGASGTYTVPDFVTPGTVGYWTIQFSKDGSFAPNTTANDLLETFDPGVATPEVPPLTPIADDGSGQAVGPCQAWTSSDLAAACCGADSDVTLLDGPVVAASQMLWRLSNGLFSGTCERRVRPCGTACGGPWQRWDGWGWLPINRGGQGLNLGQYGSWGGGRYALGCGCGPLSRIPLAGAVREILEVTIDGQILAPTAYRVDERRWLTRIDGDAWPACQDMTLPETDDGTFSILYTYGQDPPVIGQYAAAELACAIYQTCSGGGSAAAADCDLPAGVVEVQRQGVTLKYDPFLTWGFVSGKWNTGLPNVDRFLNTLAPEGQQGRPSRAWSPDVRRFPRPVVGAS